MTISSVKTFYISLLVLLLSLVQLIVANQGVETAATRDFDFGPPMLIVLSVVQIGVAGAGVTLSLSVKKSKRR